MVDRPDTYVWREERQLEYVREAGGGGGCYEICRGSICTIERRESGRDCGRQGMSRSEAVNYYLKNCSSGEGTGLVL